MIKLLNLLLFIALIAAISGFTREQHQQINELQRDFLAQEQDKTLALLNHLSANALFKPVPGLILFLAKLNSLSGSVFSTPMSEAEPKTGFHHISPLETLGQTLETIASQGLSTLQDTYLEMQKTENALQAIPADIRTGFEAVFFNQEADSTFTRIADETVSAAHHTSNVVRKLDRLARLIQEVLSAVRSLDERFSLLTKEPQEETAQSTTLNGSDHPSQDPDRAMKYFIEILGNRLKSTVAKLDEIENYDGLTRDDFIGAIFELHEHKATPVPVNSSTTFSDNLKADLDVFLFKCLSERQNFKEIVHNLIALWPNQPRLQMLSDDNLRSEELLGQLSKATLWRDMEMNGMNIHLKELGTGSQFAHEQALHLQELLRIGIERIEKESNELKKCDAVSAIMDINGKRYDEIGQLLEIGQHLVTSLTHQWSQLQHYAISNAVQASLNSRLYAELYSRQPNEQLKPYVFSLLAQVQMNGYKLHTISSKYVHFSKKHFLHALSEAKRQSVHEDQKMTEIYNELISLNEEIFHLTKDDFGKMRQFIENQINLLQKY